VAAALALFAAPVAASPWLLLLGRSRGCYTLSNSNEVTNTLLFCINNGNDKTATIFLLPQYR
jgi:hypothetical protein